MLIINYYSKYSLVSTSVVNPSSRKSSSTAKVGEVLGLSTVGTLPSFSTIGAMIEWSMLSVEVVN